MLHQKKLDLSEDEYQLVLDTLVDGSDRQFIFENWSKTFSCAPNLYLSPSNEAQLIQIINIARKNGSSVKAVGAGLSPSDISCTEGIMINMKKFNRVLKADVENSTITVESGLTINELHTILKFWGMAFSSIGSVSEQTIAGVISTAAHGTGLNFGCFSSMILDLVLIDGLGRRHYCSRLENKDLFDAARCSLGALGVITELTIQCEPSFNLHATQVPEKLDTILTNLPEILNSAEHVRFWWFPHTDDAVLWKANRTKKQIQPLKESLFTDKLYGFHYYQLQLFFARFFPNRIPSITKEHYKARFNKNIEWVDESYKVFNFDCLFPQYVNEWAIPIENTATALLLLRKWINEQYDQKTGARVHFPIEVRFVEEDDVWLSPCYKRAVCYIGVIMYRPFHLPVPYKKYWKVYEDIMRSLDGRPHWAKAHQMYHSDFMESFPRFGDFNEIRKKCDPNGLFVNDYIRRHILPPSESLSTAKSISRL
ncbi:L-gulonolactone oxidase [Smittium culicis]|uniref:D-arabinono-1,4-lactone oxidase n=1 Tax=Smittium culicis TaxID=133412 RepID=A0A1R1XVT8_9FUNG|nr:L-gulonolactone oxidase [Smittium culicis]